jgi:hypothetical protein
MKHKLETTDNLALIQAERVDITTEGDKITGVVTHLGAHYGAKAVIIASGTYLTGKIIIGDRMYDSGPDGIFPVNTKTGIEVMSVNLLVDDETKPVVWRGPVIAGTVKQFWSEVVWNEVDFMFVDMPPGTGDVPLTVFQSLPLDGIVIVTSPQELVGMIVEKAVNMASLMDVRVLGLVENYGYIVCPDCGKVIRPYGESKIHALAEKYNTKVLAELPIDPNLASVCDKGLVELFEGDYLERCCDELEKMN